MKSMGVRDRDGTRRQVRRFVARTETDGRSHGAVSEMRNERKRRNHGADREADRSDKERNR